MKKSVSKLSAMEQFDQFLLQISPKNPQNRIHNACHVKCENHEFKVVKSWGLTLPEKTILNEKFIVSNDLLKESGNIWVAPIDYAPEIEKKYPKVNQFWSTGDINYFLESSHELILTTMPLHSVTVTTWAVLIKREKNSHWKVSESWGLQKHEKNSEFSHEWLKKDERFCYRFENFAKEILGSTIGNLGF